MDVIAALNKYMPTEDNTPITRHSLFYRNTLWEEIVRQNQTHAELIVQAYIGRVLMQSGERLVASLAHGRLNRRELYPEVRHTLLEMMLVVAMATLAYVLLKKN